MSGVSASSFLYRSNLHLPLSLLSLSRCPRRLSFNGYFPSRLRLFSPSLFRGEKFISSGRRCNASPGRSTFDPRIVSSSPRVQCSFLRRFRNRLLFTRDMKCFALLLHALLPRGYTPSTRLRVGGGGVDVVNMKEIWKLLVDNVTVLRQYVLSYR